MQILKFHPCFTPLGFPTFIYRAAVTHIIVAVGATQGKIAQALSDGGFASRMDIVTFERLCKIVGAHHAAVGDNGLRLELGFAQPSTIGPHAAAVIIRGYFHIIERNFAQAKLRAPTLHHRGKTFRIRVMMPYIGTTLIPY